MFGKATEEGSRHERRARARPPQPAPPSRAQAHSPRQPASARGAGAEAEERRDAVNDLSEKAQNAMRAGFSDVATAIQRVESS